MEIVEEINADRFCRLSKKLKNVAVGGHAPTTATPTGKFYGKLCARSVSDECAICREILSKGIPKGEIGALGAAVRGCCPLCSVSSFSTR